MATMQVIADRLTICLGHHIESYDGIDAGTNALITHMLSYGQVFWKPGEPWSQSRLVDRDKFQSNFDRELELFHKLAKGIQTRVLGSLVISNPQELFASSQASQFIVAFRKIHDGYEMMLIASSRSIEGGLSEYSGLVELIEKECKDLAELLAGKVPELFKTRMLGPLTVFYYLPLPEHGAALENELRDPSSQMASFLQRFLCTTGVDCTRLPRSSIDASLCVVRHPSYHYTPDMSERLVVLPVDENMTNYTLLRTIDIFSSMEYYYTRFLYMIRAAEELMAETHEKSQSILYLLRDARLCSLTSGQTGPLLAEVIERGQELFDAFPTTDLLLEEAEHMYNDAGYLISGIVAQSAYGESTEKRLGQGIEGVAESIGKEMDMRLHHIKVSLPRRLGRSYNSFITVSNLIRARYDLLSNEATHLLNQTMLDHTRQIKYLTILVTMLTFLAVAAAALSIPGLAERILG